MDFDFSDDQLQLRDAVRRWVDKGYPFERRRAIVKAGGFDADAWRELAELGLCGLLVPPEHDGLGLGPVEAMVVLEELGRGLVLEPLLQSLVASVVLAQTADAAVQSAWLPRIASGEALVVLAATERGARYRTHDVQAKAVATQTGWALSATKNVVPAGDKADAVLLLAQTPQGRALFLVPRDAPGVQCRAYGTQDGSRAADLTLRDAPATRVCTDGDAALDLALDVAVAGTCALAVGVMDQAMAATVEYLNTRKQFGVPLASFQALRHRVADMKMALELARSMSYYATLKLQAPAPERHAACARAKVQLGQSMRLVGQQSVQLHGGIGVTDELILSHYFKQLTQYELLWGDTLHHLATVSEHMQDSAGVFA